MHNPETLQKAIAVVRDLRLSGDDNRLQELERLLGGLLPPIGGTAVILFPSLK